MIILIWDTTLALTYASRLYYEEDFLVATNTPSPLSDCGWALCKLETGCRPGNSTHVHRREAWPLS